MCLMHLVSSAYIKGKVDDKQLHGQIVNIYVANANKSGPRILPCGTSDVTLIECDSALFMRTY